MAKQQIVSSKERVEPTIPEDIQELAKLIESDGGQVLAIYQEPYANAWQLFVMLPMERVKPTPYQRDLSDNHVERLVNVIRTVGRFLDPIVAVRMPTGEYWTPNGNHRRAALEALGKKMIPAILLPDQTVAFQILALNTEKAHNLKEKSLEVIRMYRGLIEGIVLEDASGLREIDMAFQFEEAYYATLGLIYERVKSFSGGPYTSLLRKVDRFLELPLREAYEVRVERSQKLRQADEIVVGIVRKLKERGITHPFVKHYVVSQCNPIGRARKVAIEYDEAIDKLTRNLQEFDVEAVRAEDIAHAAIVGESE
ncbi:MAG: ParB/RepB/Spo0J family partition protein [Armatimonadota bacterium]|nr:ParB/RepB/Spo0J family partition protein [Armatimonadota bacterium]MCX7777487.1 ParB/RepB/Spo0J family partition protein [Armatimonadota bacterium]MDW8025504.1 ParB/RepB/Spo0J family partition protein [Armatimonadota bacterium]